MTAPQGPFADLSKEDLLKAAHELIRMAGEGTAGIDKSVNIGTERDPLVRKLAAMALYDLLEKAEAGGYGLSFRQIGDLFGVSHTRVMQLRDDLVGREATPEEVHKRKRA